MKKLTILFFGLIISFGFAIAQTPLPPASKPDAELTKKEAEARILDFKARVENLSNDLKNLEDQINQAKSELGDLKQKYEDCRKEILSLVGATNADIEAFRQKLGIIQNKVNTLKSLSNDALIERQAEVKDLEDQLNQLRSIKIAVLPEFYDKIIAIGKDIRGLYREKKYSTYTVGTWSENRDCLWNISGKMEIFSDPLLWVKIWQANTDKIKNPDIIFPGQVLTIPAKSEKTPEEIKAERTYWRKKRAQMANKEQTPTKAGE